LRPGFRPTGPYEVSFVFLHSGTPFARKGGSEISLPRLDVPVDLLQWEVFLPEQYKVKDFGGDVMAANLVPVALVETVNGVETGASFGAGHGGGIGGGMMRSDLAYTTAIPGQLGGIVLDMSGAVISGAHVTVTSAATGTSESTVTDASGHWLVSSLPSGRATVRVESQGFKATNRTVDYDASRGREYAINLQLGTASEQVEVTAEAPTVNTETSNLAVSGRNFAQLQQLEANAKKREQSAASENVMNLQRRVAGVLPVAIEVPRTGTSFAFVRPLVLDEETKVTFTYKSK